MSALKCEPCVQGKGAYGHITGVVLMQAGNECHLMHLMNIITPHHFSSGFLILLFI